MESKKCTKCFNIKPLSEFYKDTQKSDGHRPDCKDCGKSYHLKNRDSILVKMKERRELNKDRYKTKQREYYVNNKELVIKKNNAYYLSKRNSDPVLQLKHDLSKQLRMAMKGTWKYTDKSKGYPTIGLPYEELVKYLWGTFELNYGLGRAEVSLDLLHIDHIIPLSTAQTVEDVRRLNHYTNLQLLFKDDNQAKGTKHGLY